MRLGIRGKLFAVSFGLIILSLLAGEIYLRPSIEANLLDLIRADLFVRLALMERAASTRGDLDRAAWDALADDLAPHAQGRVTFMDAAGTVVGDSEVATRRPGTGREPPRSARGRGRAGRPRAVVDALQRHHPASA